jgi:ankyrin repeat protein
MAASGRYLLQMLFFGFVLCLPGVIYAQQDTTTEGNYNQVVLIDTSDYMPLFYDNALNYNLIIASSRGYISEIDRLIALGADVNTETQTGVTPLIFAVLNNREDAVNALLKYNPVLDKVTSSYETPLLIAVKNNNLEISEILIQAGADVDFPDRNGATPLHYASINGYLELTDLLLYYNASIDQKSDDGITPLLAAIMAGYANVTDLLIQNGANMEARNNKGYTPFIMASVNGDTLIMDLLFRHGVDIYAANNDHYNALDLSISSNQPEAVRYLLRIGNKWSPSPENAVDPYVVATKYRRREMVSLLRENKVPGQVKYGIDQTVMTISSRFTSRDYYSGFSLAFKEPYLNGGLITGFDMKLWYTRVLQKESEQLFYQYWDRGYLVYGGVFKDFKLYENPFKSSFIFSTTLMAGYSFGHTLKGRLTAPANEFMVIPDIMVKWNRKNFGVSIGMEYIKSQFYRIGPVWLRAGLSYTLFFDKVRTQVTPIKWY